MLTVAGTGQPKGDGSVPWVVLFFVAWLVVLFLIPVQKLKRLWPAGLVGLAAVYAIDSTFIGLGAYSYSSAGPALSGIPVFYLLSIVAGSILLAYFRPNGSWKQLLFVLGMALGFLLIETAMVALRYFHYLSWSTGRSFLLDVAGFIMVLWLAEKAGAAGKEP